jgi:hypothetical protein
MAAFVQARNYTPGRVKAIRLIVWHDMEAPEAADTAENVANWFAGPDAPQASAHVCVDDNSWVDTVHLGDTAWAAPGANDDGVSIEQAGYASQDRQQWLDPYSRATTANAVTWVKQQPELAHIPWRWLTDAQIRDGKSAGHIEHRDATRALGIGTHQDCGPNFPRDLVMSLGADPLHVSVSPVLSLGATGNKVADVQRVLDALSPLNKCVAIDGQGVFGHETRRVLCVYQQHRSLPVTGTTTLETWAALRLDAHGGKK